MPVSITHNTHEFKIELNVVAYRQPYTVSKNRCKNLPEMHRINKFYFLHFGKTEVQSTQPPVLILYINNPFETRIGRLLGFYVNFVCEFSSFFKTSQQTKFVIPGSVMVK